MALFCVKPSSLNQECLAILPLILLRDVVLVGRGEQHNVPDLTLENYHATRK